MCTFGKAKCVDHVHNANLQLETCHHLYHQLKNSPIQTSSSADMHNTSGLHILFDIPSQMLQ